MNLTSIARAGLAAAEEQIAVSAQRIANLNTQALRAEAVEQEGGGVRVTLSAEARAPGDAPSGTEVTSDVLAQSVGMQAYRANLRLLDAQQELTRAQDEVAGRRL